MCLGCGASWPGGTDTTCVCSDPDAPGYEQWIPDLFEADAGPLPPWPEDNYPIFLRDAGRCCYQVPGVCRGRAESTDHRIHGNRKDRRPSNLISACGDGTTACHGWAEAHPADAEVMGWTVRHETVNTDTATIPVYLHHAVWGTGWFILDDRYGVTPTTPPQKGE